tara:strand:+ start:2202 stop:2567 length:366 start_codon:yes stop_codon:yes gene_type:complete
MKNATKILARSAYMFDPKDRGDPDETEFRRECARAAGQFLAYIVGSDDEEGDSEDLLDPVALGGLIIAVASLAKLQEMDLHELIGATMSAYRDTDVQVVDPEGEDDDDSFIEWEDDDGTKH